MEFDATVCKKTSYEALIRTLYWYDLYVLEEGIHALFVHWNDGSNCFDTHNDGTRFEIISPNLQSSTPHSTP